MQTFVPSVTQHPIRLNQGNLLLWKLQLEMMLKGYGLLHHMDGSQTSPPCQIDGVVNPMHSLWERQDNQIMSWILTSIEPSFANLIVGAISAQQAWEKLVNAFAAGSRLQIRSLKRQLSDLKRNDDLISIYIQKAKSLVDQLADLGHIVTDEDLVDCIIMGLGEKFKLFSHTIQIKIEPITLEQLYGMLLNEERLLKSTSETITISPSAHFVGRSGSASRGHGCGHGRDRGRIVQQPWHGQQSWLGQQHNFQG